jgi:hypothetical protein
VGYTHMKRPKGSASFHPEIFDVEEGGKTLGNTMKPSKGKIKTISIRAP